MITAISSFSRSYASVETLIASSKTSSVVVSNSPLIAWTPYVKAKLLLILSFKVTAMIGTGGLKFDNLLAVTPDVQVQ